MASNLGNWWDYQKPRIKEFLRGDPDSQYVTEYDMPQRASPVPEPSAPAQPPPAPAQQATRMPGQQEIYQSLVNGVPTFSDQPGPRYQVTKSRGSSGQQDTNVVPGLKPVEYARAMQAFLRDGQYANASAMAKSPQDLQEIGRVRRMNEIKRELSNPISMKQSFSSMGAQKKQRAALAKELETLQGVPALQSQYAAALAGKQITARAGAAGDTAEMHKNFAEAYDKLYPTDVQGVRDPRAPAYTDFVQQYLTGQQMGTAGGMSPMQTDALRNRPEYAGMMEQMRKKYAGKNYSDSQLESAIFRDMQRAR